MPKDMRQLFLILTFLTLFGCNEDVSMEKTETLDNVNPVDLKSNFNETNIDKDSSDFFRIISKLEKVKFFLRGQDSIFVTKDLTKLIELNSTKNAFYSSFDKTDTGLVNFMTVDIARKLHVKLIDGKIGTRPSGNIIQLTFKDTKEASDWFNIFDNSPKKKAIQVKPKTELWLHENHVYFVQTYHTPEKKYLDLIKTTIKDNLEK
jgi:hypothetical protein